MTLSKKRTPTSAVAVIRLKSNLASWVNGFLTMRARLTAPKLQVPLGGNGCSPQGLVQEMVSIYLRLFIALIRSMKITPGSLYL